MPRISLLLLLCGVSLPAAGPADAQREPRRPRLLRDADTNDARAYLEFGMRQHRDAWKAQDAFYWASRLEPNQPTYLYARYHALMSRQTPDWQRNYKAGVGFVVDSKDGRLIDSVLGEVMLLDPYAYVTMPCQPVDRLDRELDRAAAGLVYWLVGCYGHATAAFGEALDRDPTLLVLRLYRAQGFYIAETFDSTVTELAVLVDSLRARDTDRLAHTYESKAMFEYMAGIAHERRADPVAARAAYGRALTEDLGFAMAHARLARLAGTLGSVDEALAEYDLAVGLRPHDGVLRYEYGTALYTAHRHAEAEAQLREAVRLEPYWASARFNMAVALDAQGKHAEAIAEYEAYLARCPRRLESQAEQVRRRIAGLRATAG